MGRVLACAGMACEAREEPLREDAASSWSSLSADERVDAAVPGLEPVVDCLVRDGISFTGGAGATGSSVGSTPSGPNGPIESSSVSRVVDCARLP